MPGLALYPELTPALVAQWAGAQRHSPGWEQYSLKHERLTDDAVAQVQNGKYWLKLSHIGGQLVGAHWLKLMDYPHSSWVDGFIFPDFRAHPGLQQDEWALFEGWAADMGFPDLLCASFVTNTAGNRWIVERCKFTQVGTRLEASPKAPEGVYEAVEVYAKRHNGVVDIQQARKRVDEALPGRWA